MRCFCYVHCIAMWMSVAVVAVAAAAAAVVVVVVVGVDVSDDVYSTSMSMCTCTLNNIYGTSTQYTVSMKVAFSYLFCIPPSLHTQKNKLVLASFSLYKLGLFFVWHLLLVGKMLIFELFCIREHNFLWLQYIFCFNRNQEHILFNFEIGGCSHRHTHTHAHTCTHSDM